MNTVGFAQRNKRALVVCSILLLGATVFWFLRELPAPEPVYQGRPLQAWLREFDHLSDSTNYAAARAAMLELGPNVLPHLERYLRHKDWRYKRQWTKLRAKLHLLQRGVDYEWDWHRRAAKACGQFGEAGAPAFPALMEAAQGPAS